jgi:hypothetical protein
MLCQGGRLLQAIRTFHQVLGHDESLGFIRKVEINGSTRIPEISQRLDRKDNANVQASPRDRAATPLFRDDDTSRRPIL